MPQFPEKPNLEWLRKQAKRRLVELRRTNPKAQLAEAQFHLALDLGFSSWRELKTHVDSLTVDGRMIVAARTGDAATLAALLDAHPEKLNIRIPPYDHTLLHAGAGHVAVVDLLLKRGFDPNVREKGDNTYAMHWAAAAGELEVVERLADAGGDVIGEGDDHAGGVIGWASCWEGTDTEKHRAVREFLLSRGAHHHIFSATGASDAPAVRRIVAENPAALNQRQSRNENNRTPLQFAVAMNRPDMVALLIELGADPLAVDAWGMPAAGYAMRPDIDRPIMEKIRAMTGAEVVSAERGHRLTSTAAMDLVAAMALQEWATATRLVADNPRLLDPSQGVLHMMAKRGDAAAVTWLLDHGGDPNGRWPHFDADVTPLHLVCLANHPAVASVLLDRSADPSIHDSKHDSDASGWAQFFKRAEIIQMLKDRAADSGTGGT